MLFIKSKVFVVSLDFFACGVHLPYPTFLQSYRHFPLARSCIFIMFEAYCIY